MAERTLTGADAVAAALEAAGVEVAFGLPGVHNLALWRALGDSRIRLVGVRHEQAAAYAADGYARASGKLGVAVVTTGPGAANTLGAVGEAWASRQPVLVIATDVPTSVRRHGVWRGALHEATDQAAMFAPVVKEVRGARAPDELASQTAAAAEAALRHPTRPAYLELPTNLLSAETGDASPSAPEQRRAAEPDPGQLAHAAELLTGSRGPLVWAGGGALQSGAGEALAALAERLVAPVMCTYSARGLLPPGHPCLVEAPPHVPEAGVLWDEADCVLAVGSDLDAMMTQGWRMPRPRHLIAVNIDPADAAKNYLPDLLVEADAHAALAALAKTVEPRTGLEAIGRRLGGLNERVRRELEPDPRAFLAAVERALPPEAVVVCDMCIPGYWLGGFHRTPAPRKLLYPLGWGTLGCAFPQALGAALADAGPAVSISGDGGFLYAAGELATAAQERIPLTAVIVDDGGYGMLRYDQDRRGDPRSGVDLHTPDFAALAGSFGVRADAVEGLGDDFAAALERHAALPEPSVLVARAALPPPPNVSPRWYRQQRRE